MSFRIVVGEEAARATGIKRSGSGVLRVLLVRAREIISGMCPCRPAEWRGWFDLSIHDFIPAYNVLADEHASRPCNIGAGQ